MVIITTIATPTKGMTQFFIFGIANKKRAAKINAKNKIAQKYNNDATQIQIEASSNFFLIFRLDFRLMSLRKANKTNRLDNKILLNFKLEGIIAIRTTKNNIAKLLP